jgi:tetratricopeptide (TPR) repeat protein
VKIISFLVWHMLFFTTVNAQQFTLADAIAKEKILDENGALQIYEKLLLQNPNDAAMLLSTSFLYSRIGVRQTKEVKKKYFLSAKKLAEKAILLQPTSAQANYILGLAYGRMAEIGGISDKITYSRLIKKYADLAIKYNPAYAYGWHLLGKYNWEISQINTLQMAAVKTIYGGLPEGNLPAAIMCFEKCRSLDADFKTNLVDLAIAYTANKQLDKVAILKQESKKAKPRFVSEVKM